MSSSQPRSFSCRNGQHRDTISWNKKKFQCCLSCGEMLILASDIYRPIPSSTGIRILTLKPGQKDADLVGELEYANLNKNPRYDAISYTWADETGNNQACRPFYVWSDTNSPSAMRILAITKNCDAALRRFRDQNVPRYLWIDSICIDQSNLLERSEQVELMADIYRSAQRVLIFLSDPPHHIVDDFKPLFDAIHYRFLLCDQDAKTKQLLKLFQYQWFNRIWVIQEALLSSPYSVELILGELSVSWYDFVCETKKLFNSMGIEPGEAKIPAVLQLDSEMIRKAEVKLPELLVATNSCGATDPRDKIFALLSLTSKIDRSVIRVDYTMSCEELFAITTEYCINHYGPSILSIIQDRTSSQSSWVPNYISTEQPGKLIPIQFTKDNIPFENIRLAFNASQDGDQMVLRVNGMTLDFVEHIQPKRDQTFARLKECDRYLVTPAPLEEVVESYRQMLGINTSLDDAPLWFLLHKPKSEPKIWEWLQPGVDPNDMTSIDLLAPWHYEAKEIYFPYCTFFLASFLELAGQFLQGRQAFCGKDTIGVCPRGTKVGDFIFKAEGLNPPLVLRRCQSTGNCVIVGPCQIVWPRRWKHLHCKSYSYHHEPSARWVEIENGTTLYHMINIV